MKKDAKVIKSTIYSLTFVSIIALIYYVFHFTELYFTSDAAAVVLLAKEQLEKRQFFPDGFCYSTGLFVVSPSVFIAPLMRFFDDWLLCRELGMLPLIVALFILMFVFYNKIGVNEKKLYAPCIAVTLMCLPMGHYQETYFAAGYVAILLAELLILLFLFHAISSGGNKKKAVFCFMGLLVSIYVFNIASMHYWAIIMIPIILTIFIYAFIEYCDNGSLVFKSKKIVCALVILIVGFGFSYVSYHYLMEKVGALVQSGGITFSMNISENLNRVPQIVSWFYNAISNCELLSLRGILNCVNFVILVIATFIVPVLSIVLYKKVKNKFLRMYIIYTWVSDFVVLYMIIFTTAISAGERYYQTIFFHKLILMALFIGYLLEHKMVIVRVTIWGAMIVTVFMGHAVYASENLNAKREYEQANEYSITDYLKDNNLTYGCATFWNAYNNMVLSNGEIIIVGVNDGGNSPYYWLTSREWYDTEMYSGRSFYLLSEGQTIDSRFYEEAVEIKYFKEYTILIFEQNVLEYQFYEPVVFEHEITVDKLHVGDNAYIHSNEIILKKNGLQYGPYVNLYKGLYEVEISGTDLNKVTTEIVINMSGQEISYNTIERTAERILLAFEIPEDNTIVEIVNKNESDTDIKITGMYVKKKS